VLLGEAHDGDASQLAMATVPKAVGGASRLARPTRAISADRLYPTGDGACLISRKYAGSSPVRPISR
jgi:hypothetical protein